MLCSIISTYHTDICVQSSSEHFFDVIDVMFQFAETNNCDVTKTEVTAVMETIRNKGSILDAKQSEKIPLDNKRTNTDIVTDKMEIVTKTSATKQVNGA